MGYGERLLYRQALQADGLRIAERPARKKTGSGQATPPPVPGTRVGSSGRRVGGETQEDPGARGQDDGQDGGAEFSDRQAAKRA